MQMDTILEDSKYQVLMFKVNSIFKLNVVMADKYTKVTKVVSHLLDIL